MRVHLLHFVTDTGSEEVGWDLTFEHEDRMWRYLEGLRKNDELHGDYIPLSIIVTVL